MTKKRFLFWAIAIALLHIALVLYFGTQKAGFHEDEYYTYWSVSSESIGPSNLTRHSGYELQSRFFVKDGQQFSYGMVVENQAEDVHPPLYYMALHTLMSLFSNSFYKWFGIFLNLAFSLITYGSIVVLFYLLSGNVVRHGEYMALLAGMVYAVAPSTISAVMLTRMYAMSTMWTALYALVFAVLMKSDGCSRKKFAGIVLSGAAICYCAFLTHYYALFVPFFLTLAYCIYRLVQRKELLRMFVYGGSMVIAILMAVITYPACISHIFGGYRGTGAISGLLGDSLFGRTVVFNGWIDSAIFAGWMLPCVIVFLLFAVLGIVLMILEGKNRERTAYVYKMVAIGMGCLISYWLLTKVALLVGEDASRYFYPVIALALPYMAYTVVAVAVAWKERFLEGKLQLQVKKPVNIVLSLVLLGMVLMPLAHSYGQEKVLFLYREDAEKVAFSQEYSEYPLIMAYSSDVSYRSWYVDNQLWPFENVFYVDNEYLDKIDDPVINQADKIVVYMDAPEDYLQKIIEDNPNLSKYTLVRHDKFFYIYLLE